eukprot:COSAG05_NODE_2391_length_3127_cov_4.498349_4_plen_41_part_00
MGLTTISVGLHKPNRWFETERPKDIVAVVAVCRSTYYSCI